MRPDGVSTVRRLSKKARASRILSDMNVFPGEPADRACTGKHRDRRGRCRIL
jgi:hypothetical protein